MKRIGESLSKNVQWILFERIGLSIKVAVVFLFSYQKIILVLQEDSIFLKIYLVNCSYNHTFIA